MNEVLMRSLITALTTLIPIGSLLFVGSFLLGARPLEDFALALFIGVAAGTFSSLFLSTPLLAVWREREPHWQRMQRRAPRRSGAPPTEATVPPAFDDDVVVAAPAAATTAGEVVTQVPGDVVARPPRQRRKRR
jgi:preprotein translocase subunit SecF